MNVFAFFIILLSYFMICTPVRAEYVLPYPSYMPGNKLYRISRLIDEAKKYWYWGTIAEIKYHLGLSDKYLVEAKTLFEYKQYLLATDALKRSDKELFPLLDLLKKGSREGKNMVGQEQLLSDAMQVHVVIITVMKKQLPDEFQWSPEKANATNLPIGSLLDASIQIRQSIINNIQRQKTQFTYRGL